MSPMKDSHPVTRQPQCHEALHIASVSGLGCGTVIAGLLRAASEQGHLTEIRKTPSSDERNWFEFQYSTHDSHSGQKIAVATSMQQFVVEGELWRTQVQPKSAPFHNAEQLRGYLRYIDCLESISSIKANADGTLTELCLGFSGCAPLLLTRQL